MPTKRKKRKPKTVGFEERYDEMADWYEADPIATLFEIMTNAELEANRLNAAKELLSYRYQKLKPLDVVSPEEEDKNNRPINWNIHLHPDTHNSTVDDNGEPVVGEEGLH